MDYQSGVSVFRFKAFLSYARADDRVANWLHKSLESYVTPRGMTVDRAVNPLDQRSLKPIFRDRADLSGGGLLAEKLKQNLEDSEFLIVLCSPSAATSDYVNQEVQAYIDLGRVDRIYPVLAPNSTEPVVACMPSALRNLGLLAADLREKHLPGGKIVGDGREGGKLKLIAGILGVGLDQLLQRERKRQNLRNAVLTGLSGLFLVLALAAATGGWEAVRNARKAHDTLDGYFAVNGWEQVERGNPVLAAKYALAGHLLARSNPANAQRDLALLQGAAYRIGYSLYPIHLDGSVNSIVFSRDNKTLRPGSDGGTFGEWSAQDGHPLAQRHSDLNGSAEVNLSPNGTYMISADNGAMFAADSRHEARIYDAATGRLTATYSENIEIYQPSISADDSRALVHDALSASVLDAHTGKRLFEVGQATTSAVFSPDGGLVAAGGRDGSVGCWRARDGKPAFSIKGHTSAVETVAFSADGQELVSAGTDGRIKIWRSADGSLIQTLVSADADVTYVRLASDGRLAVTVAGNKATLWDIHDGKAIATLAGHTDAIRSADFSPDGQVVATGSVDHTAKLWSTDDGHLIATLSGHTDVIDVVAFSHDGNRLATGSFDRSVRVWDVSAARNRIVAGRRNALPQPATYGNAKGVNALFSKEEADLLASSGLTLDLDSAPKVFSPDGNLSAEVSSAGQLIVRFASDGSIITQFDVSDSTSGPKRFSDDNNVDSIRFSDNNSKIAVSFQNKTAKIFDIRTGKSVLTLSGKSDILYTGFSPDGGHVITTELLGRGVDVWDLSDGRHMATLDTGAMSPVSGIFSGNGAELDVFGTDGAVAIDTRQLTQPWPAIAQDACQHILGSNDRNFTQAEIDADPLLRTEWPDARRDLCEGIPGIAALPGGSRHDKGLKGLSAVFGL